MAFLATSGAPITIAAARGMATEETTSKGMILDIKRSGSEASREASGLYRHRLVLVRPDQHLAWRGDAELADPISLVDLVRGAAQTTMAKLV
jgi:hypothetical protein